MYILYLDESGAPHASGNTSHYVLLGMAVHVGTWFALTKQVAGLKRRYALGSLEDFELHAAYIQRSYREQELISDFADLSWSERRISVTRWRDQQEEGWKDLSTNKRRKEKRFFRFTDAYCHLTRLERNRLFGEALDIVGDYRRGIHLFAEAIDKKHLHPAKDPIEQAFTQVTTRFERFLQNQSKGKQGPVWGLIVMDHDPKQVPTLSSMLRQFQRDGTRWSSIERIVEAPFFLDSRLNAGVQVVDLCAYALRRYLEHREEEHFQRIFPKFYRTPSGLHGLRHFTRPGCPCLVCRERGHG